MLWILDTKINKINKGNKMKLVKTLLGVLFASALFTVTAIGAANAPVVDPGPPHSDLWKMTLAGSGAVQTQSPSDAAVGLTLGLSRNVTVLVPAEFGVRQSVGWADVNQGSTWLFTTTVFNDWRIVKVGNVELLAGGRIGPTYGNTTTTWAGGPEAEARLWMKKDVYTFVRAGYDFAFSNSGIKSKDSVGLVLGVGFSF